jgi:diguanylate cyclase (GGDEF)-like protein
MLSDDRESVRLGDLVDVVGFPTIKDFKPTLESSTLRVIGRGVKLTATPAAMNEVLDHGYDQNLIQIDGELIGQDKTTGDLALELRSGNFLYSAVLPNVGREPGAVLWKDGSTVRLTGICEVLLDPRTSGSGSGAVRPGSLRILLRAGNDIAVLHVPSWWTRRRVLALLAAVGFVAFAAVAWSVSLRRRVEQQTEVIRQNEERLRHLSEHDVLTGLPNRFLLSDRLDGAISQSARSQCVVGILMIDIDRFKEINDTLGHSFGDLVLREVAARLTRAVRTTDTVARLGGDEFIVVLPDLNDASEAELIASKIVELMREPVSVDNVTVEISASVGVSTSAYACPDSEKLLQHVDSAMYEAKRCGRNRYQLYDSLNRNRQNGAAPLWPGAPISGSSLT